MLNTIHKNHINVAITIQEVWIIKNESTNQACQKTVENILLT